MLPSPRSASSSELFPLFAPLSPVARAERCKPCPVALVLTLGCFWPAPPSFLLFASGLSGSILPRYLFMLKSKWSSFSGTRLIIPQEKRQRPTHLQALSLVPRRARARATEKRRFTLRLCLHPCPRTHGEICVKNKSGLNRAWRQATRIIQIHLRY